MWYQINRELRAELERSQGQGAAEGGGGQQPGEVPLVGELEDRLMNYQSQIKVRIYLYMRITILKVY